MANKECKIIDQSLITEGLLNTFDYVLTDCDGVLWMGEDAIPGSPEAIQMLINKGKHVIYVTNNSTKSREDYLKKCKRLGFPATVDDIFPTSYCAAVYLKSLNFEKKVYVFGSQGIVTELKQIGIQCLPIGPDPLPSTFVNYIQELELEDGVGAVVVGFDEHVSYPKLVKAASYLKDPDCLFIASNKDEQFPSNNNLIVPGSGTFVAAIEVVTGRQSVALGKPSKYMFDCIQKKHPQIDAKRCLMIGDRLNTDILLGTSNSMQTLLVLTGISSLDEVKTHEKSLKPDDQLLVPDFYLQCLGDFVKLTV